MELHLDLIKLQLDHIKLYLDHITLYLDHIKLYLYKNPLQQSALERHYQFSLVC